MRKLILLGLASSALMSVGSYGNLAHSRAANSGPMHGNWKVTIKGTGFESDVPTVMKFKFDTLATITDSTPAVVSPITFEALTDEGAQLSLTGFRVGIAYSLVGTVMDQGNTESISLAGTIAKPNATTGQSKTLKGRGESIDMGNITLVQFTGKRVILN